MHVFLGLYKLVSSYKIFWYCRHFNLFQMCRFPICKFFISLLSCTTHKLGTPIGCKSVRDRRDLICLTFIWRASYKKEVKSLQVQCNKTCDYAISHPKDSSKSACISKEFLSRHSAVLIWSRFTCMLHQWLHVVGPLQCCCVCVRSTAAKYMLKSKTVDFLELTE